MHTLNAMALIARAVHLADSDFAGDPLMEACRCASWEDRQAVLCIVRSRPMLSQEAHPTPEKVMQALRQMLHEQGPAKPQSSVGTLQAALP
ncbi:hypothetical protein [Azohydromonas lata]|uniref:Uncharacterized protein n=1 Tax=Azohydromonas lata TaxID=45677 RepID=A0ABU5IQX0_9BURK|nr:hypothetical protein [Azohydromonas lata]MDZ5461300.1 hypothetical protein [Azohydromonas lata]